MAARFWVGGTDAWDSTAGTKWATTSGGAGGAAVPTSADDVTFDNAIAGSTGVVTVNNPQGTGSLAIKSLTLSAFTGTLDFATNPLNVTVSGAVTDAATGAHTWNLGTGTWTIQGASASWSVTASGTNLTFNGSGSTIALATNSVISSNNISFGTSFNGASTGYGTVTMQSTVSSSVTVAYAIVNAGVTIPTLTLLGPVKVTINSGVTVKIGNAFNWAGTPTAPIMLLGASSTSLISIANNSTATWASIQSIGFTGNGNFTATNSFDYGFVRTSSGTGVVSISAPSAGGGRIIGG